MRSEKILSANFLVVCFSSFAFFGSFYLLLPVLPVYTQKIGGSESDVGLIMGVFTVSAVTLRPFIGRAVDQRGRKMFLIAGAVIFLLSSSFYGLATSVPLLLLVRAFHGLGIAAFTTASSALIADIAPINRRGEAMGYYGMFASVAMAGGPALGWAVVAGFDFGALFLVSAACALAGVALTASVKEQARGAPARGAAKGALFSARVIFPSVVIFGTAVTYGAVNSFLPLYASKHEMDNPGLFFTVYAVTLIVVRVVAGWISDRYGRPAAILPGLVAVSLAMVLLGFSAAPWMFVLVAVVYGMGFAAVQPTMMALVADRVDPKERGAAMGTYTSAFDLGIGLGSILLGMVVQAAGFGVMFVVAGLVNLLGLAYYAAGVLGYADRLRASLASRRVANG